ncbi:hypothetical protein LTR97_007886 [Elasticomyces elasticus]|uniref:Uncharacterized protein n=1 Tax=Elasticomyces elasticus TaxID=574655 RepID=A0AAN7VZL7_9PEZI|nr:hypothetical protein LTR97_007886 [Elasticomyces elasticus]KAK5720772.1 hypothetical protein LTR15_006733 [Elasticomyces elasticus]
MATKPSCPFLALPLELRELIYDYVFHGPNTRVRYSIKYPDAYTSPRNFGILRASRQIYAEALPRFYLDKVFFYNRETSVEWEHIVAWLHAKPRHVHKLIAAIELARPRRQGGSKTAVRRYTEEEETTHAQGCRAIDEAGIEPREGTLRVYSVWSPEAAREQRQRFIYEKRGVR